MSHNDVRPITRERLAVLRQIPLFRGMSDRDLAWIDSVADDIEVVPGEVLMQEGRRGTESFVIVDGESEVTAGGQRLAVLGPGATFGEMSLLDFQPRSATVRALTPMRLLVLGPARFMDLLEQPGVAVRVLKGVVGRLREMDARAGSAPV